MGVRKRESADKRKEEMKNTAIARLVNVPTSPRKMRIVADLIRASEQPVSRPRTARRGCNSVNQS